VFPGGVSVRAEACRRVLAARARGDVPDPADEEACREWTDLIRMLEEFYKIKYLPGNFLPPRPDPPPVRVFPWDPSPQASIRLGNQINEIIMGELVLDALKHNTSVGNTLFNEIRETGAHIQVVNRLIQQLDEATKALRSELSILEKGAKERK
jgi:hypothetical protein